VDRTGIRGRWRFIAVMSDTSKPNRPEQGLAVHPLQISYLSCLDCRVGVVLKMFKLTAGWKQNPPIRSNLITGSTARPSRYSAWLATANTGRHYDSLDATSYAMCRRSSSTWRET